MKPGQKFPSAGYKKGTAMYSPLPREDNIWRIIGGASYMICELFDLLKT